MNKDLKEINKKEKVKKVASKITEVENDKLENDINEDKIELLDVLLLLNKYQNNEAKQSVYEDMLKKINIKKYLGIERKLEILLNLIATVKYNGDYLSEIMVADVELKKVFIGLLSYTDIDLSVLQENSGTFKSYDLMMETGFIDDILSVCGKDWERFEKMIDQAFTFDNMMQVFTTLSNLDAKEMTANLEEAKKFMDSFDKETIKDLSNIATMQDPIVRDLAKMLQENADSII